MDDARETTSPEASERVVIERALAPFAGGAQIPRHALLPVLHAVQSSRGWISKDALAYVSERMGIAQAELYGVASFYHLFSLEPSARRVLHVCDDVSCRLRGSRAIVERLSMACAPEGESRDDAAWHRSPCLGQCERAPAALRVIAGDAPTQRSLTLRSPEHAEEVFSSRNTGDHDASASSFEARQPRGALRLLRRIGVANPASLDDYRAHGGYQGLRRAHARGAAWVLRELSEARLLGRGGAGFAAGVKWSAVASAPGREKYVVCNADESEPGTFKDRVLMEGDPFALIEAMTIAGFAVGAEKGFIYVRGEYPLAAERLERAIAEARAHRKLGDDVLSSGQRFEIEVRRGAGAYICGEETALLESLEGKRGEPRSKPPFPVHEGLFAKPTLVNNVETLCAALDVIVRGAAAFASVGTADSTGTRLFCVSGHVAHPGVYELAMGMSLRELLALAGAEFSHIQAVLLGGAAGTFLRGDEIDVPLTFEDTRRVRATLGSGSVVVIDDQTSMMDVLRGLAWFFRYESCGQCVPCRAGTIRVDELVQRVRAKVPLGTWESERERLADLGRVMRDASICGLGHTATSAIESAFERFELWPDRVAKKGRA
ncbi:MAG: NAD(P)H-dependent oxidoreductase subunit E [Myxococcales bacterium]|nr:NAD(P)H-dependent oxidoreductase subunit E [Myxococcales bacterium]